MQNKSWTEKLNGWEIYSKKKKKKKEKITIKRIKEKQQKKNTHKHTRTRRTYLYTLWNKPTLSTEQQLSQHYHPQKSINYHNTHYHIHTYLCNMWSYQNAHQKIQTNPYKEKKLIPIPSHKKWPNYSKNHLVGKHKINPHTYQHTHTKKIRPNHYINPRMQNGLNYIPYRAPNNGRRNYIQRIATTK